MSVDEFSVATFNLYNLQVAGRSMNPGQRPWTQTEYDAKLAWIAGQLRLLEPDIVGVQELWHRQALFDVLAAGGLSDTYDVLAEPANGGRIICGALVRQGLLRGDPVWIDTFPEAVHLESHDHQDPQAPEISVRVTRFQSWTR